MRKTYGEIQKELASKTKYYDKLKDRMKELRTELKLYKHKERDFIVQYEKVIRDWQKRYNELINNGWKIVIVKVNNWLNKVKKWN